MSKEYELLKQAIEAVRAAKPGDRADVDRHYAVLLTMLEQVLAYAWLWIESR